MAKKKLTFEDALKQLETVVAKMEGGELPLEQCLDQYEKGVHLARFCLQELDGAQKRIEQLQKDAKGAFVLTPLEVEETEAEAGADDEGGARR